MEEKGEEKRGKGGRIDERGRVGTERVEEDWERGGEKE